MIKHCNKICPDCSCYFMPCNILLFTSTIKVYQQKQTLMGQCENCAGRIFYWQQCGWEGCCQKINLIQGQSFCQKPSFGFPGKIVQELCRSWSIHRWRSVRLVLQRPKFRNSHVTSENGAVDLEINGPCHNGILESLPLIGDFCSEGADFAGSRLESFFEKQLHHDSRSCLFSWLICLKAEVHLTVKVTLFQVFGICKRCSCFSLSPPFLPCFPPSLICITVINCLEWAFL